MWLSIDPTGGKTIIRQVYEYIRTRVMSGELKGGERLPSSRELALTLQVSRNVVMEAYELLKAEGFVESRQGAGTYVASGAYLERVNGAEPETEWLAGAQYPEVSVSVASEGVIDFRSGVPALDQFPRNLWGRLYEQTCKQTPPQALGYDKPEGRYELRSVLANYLRRTRGVICSPEQIVITSGATQALALVAKLLLSPGSKVIIEDPITQEIHTIFGHPGVQLLPISVDDDGMQTELIDPSERLTMIYVTPSHQFPTGGILPIRRRLDLIRMARASECYIVEDDYDSEFRFEGPPVSSLQGLEPDRVIYIGTFSKLLLPSLRLGYMILPPPLIEQGRKLKRLFDHHVPSLDQLVMAQFIKNGHLERHITVMKKLYRARRNTLVQALTASFGDQVTIRGHTTGLHLVAAFRGINFTDALVASILERGVRVYPVEDHALCKGNRSNELILGYSNVRDEQIFEGIVKLHEALADSMRN